MGSSADSGIETWPYLVMDSVSCQGCDMILFFFSRWILNQLNHQGSPQFEFNKISLEAVEISAEEQMKGGQVDIG